MTPGNHRLRWCASACRCATHTHTPQAHAHTHPKHTHTHTQAGTHAGTDARRRDADPCAHLVRGDDSQDAVCVDVELHLHLRHTTGCGGDAVQAEGAQALVVARELALTLGGARKRGGSRCTGGGLDGQRVDGGSPAKPRSPRGTCRRGAVGDWQSGGQRLLWPGGCSQTSSSCPVRQCRTHRASTHSCAKKKNDCLASLIRRWQCCCSQGPV